MFFLFKQKTAYEMRISDWSSDVCSSDLTVPAQVRHITDRAVRIALGHRRVTALIFPNDLQDLPMEEPPRKHGAVFSGVGWTPPTVVPTDVDLHRAAEVLNAGEKVAILVGAGAKNAVDEVIAVADLLQAGAAKALLGKQVLPDDLPWVTGSIGLLGTKPSYDLMMECDTRSEEHTSELQSLMRISYAVFCLKKKIQQYRTDTYDILYRRIA